MALALLLLLLPACRRDAAPGPKEPLEEAHVAPPTRATPPLTPTPPEEVRDALARLAAEVKASDNYYLGDRTLAAARAALAAAGDPAEQFRQRLFIGREQLELGDADAAIGELETCLSMVNMYGLDEEIRAEVLRRLALSHLRGGENQNCVLIHSPDSCIFPVGPGGIHLHKEHVRAALRYYLEYLELVPESRAARWLASVAAMQAGEYPDAVPAELRLPRRLVEPDPAVAATVPRFINVAQDLEMHRHDLAGGTVVEDLDGDGFLDIVFSSSDPDLPLSYYHATGDGGYRDDTARAGLDSELGGLNLMQTDFDDDGLADLLVLRGGWQGSQGRWPMSLLRNVGDGTFADVTRAAGLAQVSYPTQTAAWGDYDDDGDLDLYVGNEIDQPPVAGFLTEGKPFPCQLFRANGDGTFTDVAAEAGVTNDRMAKGVAWGDYDDDGDLDLYVSNIGPNRLYRNGGDGTFQDIAMELGVGKPYGRSFATWFWDYDNDGHLDIFVAGFGANVEAIARFYLGEEVTGVVRSKLYRNLGGSFEEVSERVGIDGVYLPMGANYGDLDNDGWLDFYLGTGDPNYDTLVPNVMFRNVAGERFEDVTLAGGFGHLEKGHGIAFADLDNDGDQDVVLQVGGFFRGDRSANAAYLNPGNDNHWLHVKLVGVRTNRAAFGARITVRTVEEGNAREIHLLAGTGGSFGASSLEQEIGLGHAERITALEILWPTSGERQVFRAVPLDAFVVVTEGSPDLVVSERRRVTLAAHRH